MGLRDWWNAQVEGFRYERNMRRLDDAVRARLEQADAQRGQTRLTASQRDNPQIQKLLRAQELVNKQAAQAGNLAVRVAREQVNRSGAERNPDRTAKGLGAWFGRLFSGRFTAASRERAMENERRLVRVLRRETPESTRTPADRRGREREAAPQDRQHSRQRTRTAAAERPQANQRRSPGGNRAPSRNQQGLGRRDAATARASANPPTQNMTEAELDRIMVELDAQAEAELIAEGKLSPKPQAAANANPSAQTMSDAEVDRMMAELEVQAEAELIAEGKLPPKPQTAANAPETDDPDVDRLMAQLEAEAEAELAAEGEDTLGQKIRHTTDALSPDTDDAEVEAEYAKLVEDIESVSLDDLQVDLGIKPTAHTKSFEPQAPQKGSLGRKR